MRKQWFGDSRDYVKWSCIRHEASAHLSVVYAPMLRPDSFAGEKLDLDVTRFFDKLKSFDALSELFPAGFAHLPDTYEVKHASTYFDRLQELIDTTQKQSEVLVFLDPDTGVEPESRPKDEHLRKQDIIRICNLLRPNEKLVLYQHASREGGWQRNCFDKLTHLANDTQTVLSEPFHEARTCKDVCFFTFTKEPYAQASIRQLRGKVRWEGDLDQSRRSRTPD